MALAHEHSGGTGTSTIVGDRRRAALLDAVFAHSALVAGPLDDIHLPSLAHFGRVVHPVAWVVGEHVHASGRELIAAVVAAYDIGCTLTEAVDDELRYTRRRGKPFGPFASAAVAARLLGLDVGRTAHALSYAAHLGMGVIDGADMTMEAFDARNGAQAAFLAPPNSAGSRAIEGAHGMYAAFFGAVPADLDARLAALGRDASILAVTTKRYPGSGTHVVALDLTAGLLGRAGLAESQVTELVVTLPDGLRGRFEHFESGVEDPAVPAAKLGASLRAKLALLLAGRTLVPVPTRELMSAPAARSALAKVTLRFEPRELAYTSVEIRTTSGETLRAEGASRREPSGDWQRWLGEGGERLLSRQRLRHLEGLLRSLEDVPDSAEVLAATVPDQ